MLPRPSLAWLLAVFAVLLLSACTGSSSDAARPTGPTGARREATVANDAVHARLGEPVTFDVVIDPAAAPMASGPGSRPRDLASAFRVGTKLVVWLVAAGDVPTSEVSGQFGAAEVRSVDDAGVHLRVSGRVPPTIWERHAGGTAGAERATAPGVYAVVLNGLFRHDLVVDTAAGTTATRTAAASGPGTTSGGAGPAEAARRVLGERDLAGVAFGTGERDAMERLTARFGTPSFDEPHRSTCGDARLAGWGDLVVTFRMPAGSAATGKVLVGYRYSAPHAGTQEGPTGLRTASGLEPGMSLAELRALEPDVIFVTDPDATALASWYAAPGRRLAGRLNDDVTAASVSVVEIASSLATLPVPTLADC